MYTEVDNFCYCCFYTFPVLTHFHAVEFKLKFANHIVLCFRCFGGLHFDYNDLLQLIIIILVRRENPDISTHMQTNQEGPWQSWQPCSSLPVWSSIRLVCLEQSWLWGLEPAAFTLQYSQVHAELEEHSNISNRHSSENV